jgi:hypothetical protein
MYFYKLRFCFGCLLVGLIISFGTDRVSAQIFATDTAAIYNTWTNQENFGTGFKPWMLSTTNSGSGSFAGFYIGSSDDPGANQGTTGGYIDTSGKSFGIFANGVGTPAAFAYRGLSNALAPNEIFKVSFLNTYIQNNGVMGFALRADSKTNFQNSSIFSDAGTAFACYFQGGSNDYEIVDGRGTNDSGIPFTTTGFVVEFYQLSGGQYELTILSANGGATLTNYPVATLANSSPILTFVGFNMLSGPNQNAYFNSLEQASVSIVPPVISNLSPTNTEAYAGAGTQFSFEANSLFSTVSSNGIVLFLNGVNETNEMSFAGSGTTNLQVTLNPPLQPNVLYNGTIYAADANGNVSSNNFSFNTWSAETTNIYIEASDYNYNGGGWINNFTTQEPNQDYGLLWLDDPPLFGITNIDYYVYNFQATNLSNPYRPGDLVYVEPSSDVDHDEFAANGDIPYDVGYNEPGQWEDYTRELSNITYAVYARVSGFGGGTIAFGRMATPEVSDTNQPGATLGQFVVPNTGGAQDWTFVPLTDFFSNPVLVNFEGTNTFRVTDIGGEGSYNLGYILLVALTNTAPLHPYISSGFPYPGAAGVNPETPVSFTIANATTSVNPASIQLFINSNNVTGGLTLNNNAAGTTVNYQVPISGLLPAGVNYAEAIFSDGSVTVTDSWQFSVETIPTLPGSWALTLTGSYARGFSELIAKGDDGANSADFPPSVARADAQLAGTLTNSSNNQPYPNEALNGGVYNETNTINYTIDAAFPGIFNPTSPFPDLPPGTTNNVALEANMYAYLTPGVYNFDVYSDDGFQFSAGPTPTSTNLVLASADFGRAAAGTEFSFAVTNTGLYPMQLIYFKAQLGGGGVELYSVSQDGTTDILLNDPNTAGSVPIYYLPGGAIPTLSISRSGGQAVLTWNNSNYVLQNAPVVTGPYTTINGSTTGYHYTVIGTQQFFRLVLQ